MAEEVAGKAVKTGLKGLGKGLKLGGKAGFEATCAAAKGAHAVAEAKDDLFREKGRVSKPKAPTKGLSAEARAEMKARAAVHAIAKQRQGSDPQIT